MTSAWFGATERAGGEQPKEVGLSQPTEDGGGQTPLPLDLVGVLADEWREHNNLCVRSISQDLIDNLLRGLTVDWLARGRIVRLTDRGEKHAQVIVNFRGRRHGRARIGRTRALFDRDRRSQPFDALDALGER